MPPEGNSTPAQAPGILIHSPRAYDFFVALFLWGKERAFRSRLLDLARVGPGKAVLDVACGTGSLAVLAAARVGQGGSVAAVDASPEMLARARLKAKRRGAVVDFRAAPAQALPFSAESFDVVFGTLMLHHQAPKARSLCVAEMRRVLKLGGRVLIVEFDAPPPGHRQGLIGHLHRRHGHVKPRDLMRVVTGAGLTPRECGPVGVKDMHYVLAEA